MSTGADTPAAARQPGFFADLRRRNVFRAGLAWLALSWFLIALADLLLPALGLPDAAVRWLIIVLGLLLVPVMSFAWLIEITPEGIRIDRGPEYENPENARTARRMDQVTIVLLLMAIGLSAIRQFVLPQRVEAPDTAAVQVEQPAARRRRTAVGAGGRDRSAFHRGAAVRQPQPGPRERLPGRRHGGGDPQRAGTGRGLARRLPHFVFQPARPAARGARHRARARRRDTCWTARCAGRATSCASRRSWSRPRRIARSGPAVSTGA